MSDSRWIIQMGWRNGEKWDGLNVWGTAPEAVWEEGIDVDGVAIHCTRDMTPMKPRPLEQVIAKVRDSETADWPRIVYRFVNLRTGEKIPWDALQ